MNSISIVYFTFYLFGGAYAPNAPPPPTGLFLWLGLGVMVIWLQFMFTVRVSKELALGLLTLGDG